MVQDLDGGKTMLGHSFRAVLAHSHPMAQAMAVGKYEIGALDLNIAPGGSHFPGSHHQPKPFSGKDNFLPGSIHHFHFCNPAILAPA